MAGQPDWGQFKAEGETRRRTTYLDYLLFYVLAAIVGGGGFLAVRMGIGTRRRPVEGRYEVFDSVQDFQGTLVWMAVAGVLLAWLSLTAYLLVAARRDRAEKEGVERRVQAIDARNRSLSGMFPGSRERSGNGDGGS
jgi:hypothetical protein